MQVPPFKAVLIKTMLDGDVPFGNVTEAATSTETGGSSSIPTGLATCTNEISCLVVQEES